MFVCDIMPMCFRSLQSPLPIGIDLPGLHLYNLNITLEIALDELESLNPDQNAPHGVPAHLWWDSVPLNVSEFL
jgi:hypothetical protein